MKRKLANIILILIAFTIQSSLFPFIPFLWATPNLTLIIVFTLGFIYGSKEGMLYGLTVGILMDLSYSSYMGMFMLLFVLLGYMNGILTKYFYEEYIFLPLLMCFINEFIFNAYIYILRFLVRAKFDIIFYLYKIIVPEIIITLIFTLLLYRLIFMYNKAIEESDVKRSVYVE